MTLLSWIFNLGMILFPALFVTLALPRDAVSARGADPGRMHLLSRRLWQWTVIAVLIGVVLQPTWPLPSWPPSWLMFFPLWFAGAMPALAAGRPEWGPMQPSARTRSASLKPRGDERIVPRAMLALPWFLWLCGAPAFLYAWPDEHNARFAALLGWSGTILWPALMPWILRRLQRDPEPLAEGTREQLAELSAAYVGLRTYRAWGFYWLACAATAFFSVVFWVLPMNGSAGTWIAAGGGPLIGVAGGLFGVLCSRRLGRLNCKLENIQARRDDERLGAAQAGSGCAAD